jgi:hypothetical protein
VPCVDVLQWPAEEQQAAAEAARLQQDEALRQAVHTGDLVLEGQPKGEPQSDKMAGYERLQPLLVVNGRAVWRAPGGRFAYFASDAKWWFCTGEADMRRPEAAGWMSTVDVQPATLTPDQVKGTWRVWEQGQRVWAAAPNVRVRQVSFGCYVALRSSCHDDACSPLHRALYSGRRRRSRPRRRRRGFRRRRHGCRQPSQATSSSRDSQRTSRAPKRWARTRGWRSLA